MAPIPDSGDVLAALRSQTGGLRPGPGVTQAALHDVRTAVAASIQAGQSPGDFGPRALLDVFAAELQAAEEALEQEAELQYIATAAGPGGPLRVGTRTTAIRLPGDLNDAPDWAAGQQPSRTLGPFLDAEGRAHWFDLFEPLAHVTVSRGNQVFMVLPAGTTRLLRALRLTIPAGTVWIRADQLTSGAPANSWVGIRVSGGTVAFQRGGNFANGALTVPVASTVGLQLEPEADQVPQSASFTFGPLGVERIDTADASLSAFGTALGLSRTAAGPRYEAVLRMVLVPMAASTDSLVIGDVQSTLFTPTGEAAILQGAWGLPITTADPTTLGDADGAGFVVIGLEEGLSAHWRGLDNGPARLGKTWIASNPRLLMLFSPAASHRRGGMHVDVWAEADSRRSSLTASFPKPFTVWFISQPDGKETVGLGAHLDGNFDRPLLASGDRTPIALEGSLILSQTTVAIEAINDAGFWPPVAMALSNALLTVRPAHRLFVNGTLADVDGLALDSGSVSIDNALYQLVPILADPYAANFDPRLGRDGPFPESSVSSRISWSTPEQPVLDISLNAPRAAVLELLPASDADVRDPLTGFVRGDTSTNLWMLDVSSGADQLGLSLRLPLQDDQQPTVTLRDMALQVPAIRAHALLLPQFQWEPVHNMRNDRALTSEAYVNGEIDGGPTVLAAQTVNLVPIAPVPVIRELVRAVTEDSAQALAHFTLPSGMVANAALVSREYLGRPTLELASAPLGDMAGERQIRLRAGSRLVELDGLGFGALSIESFLVGSANQTTNFLVPPAPILPPPLPPIPWPPDNTLGYLQQSFNDQFVARVPITGIDLSGYGANIFSHWLLGGDPDVGITQVSFEAFHGRTAFERVQMVTYLWPCLSRMIRTIVLERQGSGMIRRWDSGWLSTTPGRFRLPKFDRIHPGVVDGFYNIREIRDTDHLFSFNVGGKTVDVQAVYYDADVAFVQAGVKPPVVAGQNGEGRVPVRGQVGYVQLVPPQPGGGPASLMDAEEFAALLGITGPLGGPIDATVRVGSSDQQHRVTSIQTHLVKSAAGDAVPSFAVSASGAPIVTSSSRWSVVRVASDNTVQPVDASHGVPLIRANNGPFRWADPKDLLHEGDPESDYALLLSHDAQRLLFPRPKVNVGASNLASDVSPRIADPYRMLQSTGLFPRFDQAIDVAQKVELTPGNLRLATGILEFAPPPGTQGLLDRGAWKDALDYSNVRFKIDSLANWHIDVTGLQQVLGFSEGGEIFRIAHTAMSESGLPSAFGTPDVAFPPALETVTRVLDMLRFIVPGAMHGDEGPLHLDCSFSGTTFLLRAVADFEITDADGNAIDCGMGKLKGHLKVGGELSAELLAHKVHGAIFLEVEGSWQQEVFPLIYGGGLLRLAIRGDEEGHTTFDLDACTVGSVGGTVIPGLVDLEATVKYGYFIRFQDGAFHPGIVMGMEGRAKLLSGLLGFKMGIEGRLLVTPVFDGLERSHVNLYGEILVAGSVTVAWLIEERKSFSTHFEQNVNWLAIAAAAEFGLLPVP